uniref:Uncharacterized protein n=1 Tax=Oryza meridionalis TaxID=40149 RepID=A0A0E0DR84_9ORYZ
MAGRGVEHLLYEFFTHGSDEDCRRWWLRLSEVAKWKVSREEPTTDILAGGGDVGPSFRLGSRLPKLLLRRSGRINLGELLLLVEDLNDDLQGKMLTGVLGRGGRQALRYDIGRDTNICLVTFPFNKDGSMLSLILYGDVLGIIPLIPDFL